MKMRFKQISLINIALFLNIIRNKKQIITFHNIIIRLNIHATLYYKNVIIKYIIFNNYITFNDDNKYK